MHNAEYAKWKGIFSEFLKDKNLLEDFKSILIETQKNIDSSNKIKFEYLNWNKNPAIKEVAKRLKIFENVPNGTRRVNLDLEILKELGILQKLNLKSRIREKTVNFRDFGKRMTDKSDLGVIDAEIIKEPVWVRVRN